MNIVTIDGRTYHLPGGWSELNNWQFKQIFASSTAGRTPDPLQLLLILLQFGKRKFMDQYHMVRAFSSRFNVMMANPALKWLEEEGIFEKQFIPYVDVGIKRFFGPAPSMQNMSFLEYIHAEKYFVEYARKQDSAARAHLVAILYRPKSRHDNTSDIREPFDEYTVEKRLKYVYLMPTYIQEAIVFQFAAWRNWVMQLPAYAPVFDHDTEGKTANTVNFGWFGVIDDIAESPTDYLKVGAQPFLSILSHLSKGIVRAREQEQAAKRK